MLEIHRFSSSGARCQKIKKNFFKFFLFLAACILQQPKETLLVS